MIPYLEAQIADAQDREERRALVREYLQMRILQSLQRAGATIPLAFHGGTALRFLYQMPRYSEDLDFALERQHEQYNFRGYLNRIQRDLAAETYTVDVRLNDRKVVNSAFIDFRGLLNRLGISPHHDEKLSIKLEIDTNPPAGAILDTTLVRHHVDVNLQHHDPASLLAGKLHAILQRTYVKGRDWYDLYWYLRQPNWASPNLEMLNQALAQSGWDKGVVSENNWKSFVKTQLDSLGWTKVLSDVEEFLIEQQDLVEFKKDAIKDLL